MGRVWRCISCGMVLERINKMESFERMVPYRCAPCKQIYWVPDEDKVDGIVKTRDGREFYKIKGGFYK